ncbi:AAA family ATPase [Vibrio penaeicida]|uniref:AAA family ATPase n=1 Tax=Vibrio penaeicida TaxID=104609 RepID=UPI0027361D69|nr:AAA family ATPase [Vibrio penaeicida]MDP2574497.1 AAA family ATPase [Vibrio penaeicida]
MGSKDGRLPLNGDLLKQLRKQKGLSQERLAEQCAESRLYVSLSSIKRAESGNSILYRTAKELATFYSVEVEDLIQNSAPILQKKLSTIPEHTHQVLRLSIEVDNESLKSEVEKLNDRSNCYYIAEEGLLEFGWYSRSSDEFVFERIRRLCAMLQFTLKSHVRMFVESSPTNEQFTAQNTRVSQRAKQLLSQITWGDIVACPCFVSSNCARPRNVFLPEQPEFKDWRIVSMCQVQTDYFVGRQYELTQLSSTLSHLYDNHTGSTVCLTGMAGIGKTRLLHKFIEILEHKNCAPVRVQILNFGVVNSLIPTVNLIRSLFGFTPEDDGNYIRQSIAISPIASSHHLFIYWLMGLKLYESEQRLLDVMEHSARNRAITESINQLLSHRPAHLTQLVITVEDLHWANDLLLSIIQILSSLTNRFPLILILTFRSEHHLVNAPDWFQSATTIALKPLNMDESIQLANWMAPGNQEAIQRCVEKASGHPLFLRQSLLCSRLGSDVPESLEHLVVVQLYKLDANNLSAIKAASVFGQCFNLEQLQFVLDDEHYYPRTLLEHGLIKHSDQGFMFHHDLICSAVQSQLSDSERRLLNEHCAKWFEERDKKQFALHSKRAQCKDAFTILIKSAKEYIGSFQFEQALELIEEAIEIVPKSETAYALNLKGNCLYSMGKVKECIHFLELAVNQNTDSNASSQYFIDLANPYQVVDAIDKALSILQTAQNISEPTQQYAQLSEVHSMRGNILFPTGNIESCEQEHQKALHYSIKANSPKAKAKALSGLGDCEYLKGNMINAHNNFKESLKICEENQYLEIEASNRYMLATTLIYQLDTSQALAQSQQSATLAYLTGNRRAEIVSRLTAAWVLLDYNALDQAENEINMALAIAKEFNAVRFIACLMETKARLKWYQNDAIKAREYIEVGLNLVEENNLHAFIGPWLSATKAMVSTFWQESRNALEQGEKWLKQPCAGHNSLRFYQQSIRTAWNLKDRALLEKYRDQLCQCCEPSPWREFYIEQADVMLGVLTQERTKTELEAFNSKARELHMLQAQISLNEYDAIPSF